MSVPESLTLLLPTEVVAAMRRAVETGEYDSVDAIVVQSLRAWIDRQTTEIDPSDSLREAIRRSDDSGPSVPAEQVYDHLRSRLSQRQAA